MHKVKVSDADIHRHRLHKSIIVLQKPATKKYFNIWIYRISFANPESFPVELWSMSRFQAEIRKVLHYRHLCFDNCIQWFCFHRERATNSCLQKLQGEYHHRLCSLMCEDAQKSNSFSRVCNGYFVHGRWLIFVWSIIYLQRCLW